MTSNSAVAGEGKFRGTDKAIRPEGVRFRPQRTVIAWSGKSNPRFNRAQRHTRPSACRWAKAFRKLFFRLRALF